MRLFPALDIVWPSSPTDDLREIAIALVDDYGPVAAESSPFGLRVFFRTPDVRDAAAAAIHASLPEASATCSEVSDENWAERSQAAITSVTVGTITVSPPWLAASDSDGFDAGAGHRLIIQPSMGFGTGHHASTRLCLSLMQTLLSPEAKVLDVGTGSGVLAIASRLWGARQVVAIDTDADALENARENIDLNAVDGIRLVLGDISEPTGLQGFDLAFANLTGTLLCRAATALVATLGPDGLLIASGFQIAERGDVIAAMANAGAELVEERAEQDWIGAAFRRQ